ncbi:MAG: hypothetical protein ACKOAG_00425, partial [Candidatus Kapaibacterium sp.]
TSAVPLGSFSGKLYLTFEPCGIQREIDITALFVGSEIRLSTTAAKDTVIDFGNVEVGVRTVRSVAIRNTSTVPVTLGPIVGISAPFTYTLIPPPPSVLQPNDEAFIDIICLPSDTVRYDVLLPITIIQPCSDTVRIRLRVNGTTAGVAPVPFRFEIDHHTAEVGSAYSIPVRVAGADIAGKKLDALDVTVNYNPALFRVTGVRTGPALQGFTSSILSRVDGVRLSAVGGASLRGEGVAWYVDGTVLIGDALVTPIAVDTTSLALASTELTPRPPVNGSLTITGSCRLPDRLLTVGGTFGLRSLRIDKSGSVGTISYDVVGEQHTTIDIHGVTGERVVRLTDCIVKEGAHEQTFSCEELAQGSYMLVVRNGFHVRSLPFVIVR